MRLLLALCLLIATGTQAAARQHVLWSVKGEHNTVYLLGSMHLLPRGEQLPAPMINAYRDAERLVMEIDMDDLDPAQMQRTMMQLGFLPPSQSLAGLIGEQGYRQVESTARELGVDVNRLQQMQPWLAGLTLMQLQFVKLGFDPQSGVEQQLLRMAKADGKDVTGLEQIDDHIRLLAGLPAKLQREFLLYSVEDADRLSREVNDLAAAWRAGDVAQLETLLIDTMKEYPALYESLSLARNRAWISQLRPLMSQREDYLVVVGAAHLVGDGSVVDLLRRAGFKVMQH